MNPTAQAALNKLRRAAAAGNPQAKIELMKFRTMLRQAPALAIAHNAAADAAADDIVLGMEAGQEAEAIRAGDDLEAADVVAQNLPYGSDSLDYKAALRDGKHADLNAQAPWVRTVPVSALRGTLGNMAQCSTGASVGGVVPRGQLVQVANWQADSDAESSPITVTLSPVQVHTAGGTGFPLRAFAQIIYGTRGITQTIEVDAGETTQFTVCCSAITVLVGLDGGVKVGLADGTIATQQVAAMLSFGTVERSSSWTPITRTVYLDALAGIGLKSLIPPAAKSFMFYRTNSATTAVTLEMSDSTSSIRYDANLVTGAQLANPILLANDIVAVTVTKTAGADGFGEIVYELSL